MLFDMTANSNSRKIMLLNPDYPKDVTLKNTAGAATFSAVIAKKGRPDEYTYQWYVNGEAVAGAIGETYVRNVSGDKGKYSVWCEVTNKAGTVRTREATLTVKRLPVLNASYPADASVTVTDVAVIEAVIAEDGYPSNYTYQWYVNGSAFEGATGKTFTFDTKNCGGQYWKFHCVVSNEAGSVQSRTATVGVGVKWVYKDGNPAGLFNSAVDGDLEGTFVKEENGNLILRGLGPNAKAIAWTNQSFDLTGIKTIIFALSRMDATHPEDSSTHANLRFGVTTSDQLANLYYTAQSYIYRTNHYGSLYGIAVDVTHLNGHYHIKASIDRTGYYEDWVYINQVYLA